MKDYNKSPRICTEILIENDNPTFRSRTLYDSTQIQFKPRILAHVCFADAARLVYSIELLYCHQFYSIELKIIIDRFLVFSIFSLLFRNCVPIYIFSSVLNYRIQVPINFHESCENQLSIY